jgi:hypothetical protein
MRAALPERNRVIDAFGRRCLAVSRASTVDSIQRAIMPFAANGVLRTKGPRNGRPDTAVTALCRTTPAMLESATDHTGMLRTASTGH